MPTYAINKKARFDYEILDTLEAGIVLSGQEVKSIRKGGAKLSGAFVTFHNNGAFVINLHIPKYPFAGPLPAYDPEQSRKLLLKKKEIERIQGKSQEQGLTIIPLSLYTKGRHIKVEIGIAKGKKLYEKKEKIKKRDLDREMRREMKNRL